MWATARFFPCLRSARYLRTCTKHRLHVLEETKLTHRAKYKNSCSNSKHSHATHQVLNILSSSNHCHHFILISVRLFNRRASLSHQSCWPPGPPPPPPPARLFAAPPRAAASGRPALLQLLQLLQLDQRDLRPGHGSRRLCRRPAPPRGARPPASAGWRSDFFIPSDSSSETAAATAGRRRRWPHCWPRRRWGQELGAARRPSREGRGGTLAWRTAWPALAF